MLEGNTNTSLVWNDEEKTVTLKCSEQLYSYLKDLTKQGMENLDIMKVAKIYAAVKNLIK